MNDAAPAPSPASPVDDGPPPPPPTADARHIADVFGLYGVSDPRAYSADTQTMDHQPLNPCDRCRWHSCTRVTAAPSSDLKCHQRPLCLQSSTWTMH